MPTHDARFHRLFRQFAVATVCLLGVLGCEDDQAPAPQPGGIDVVAGDLQYTLKGTQLEDPVIVRVGLEDGSPAAGVDVRFQVTEGGGTLSRTLAATDGDGRTSVRWTMGPDTGTNRLRITVADNSSLSATATATSAEYYCVEEDPVFVRKFPWPDNLMMVTKYASHTAGTAGLVRYSLNPALPATFSGESFKNYPEGVIQHAVRDCAFSANGDLFISWNFLADEIVKVAPDGSISHFATLESPFGAEIALTPHGVLVGCDEFGPFYVTCRDTLFRFEGAIYSGDILTRDAANSDALACDPNNGDVYFIYKADRDLLRIPFDGTTAGTPTKVADLTLDESDFARGMVVDGEDGSVYVLVESSNTKSIVRVDAAGVLTTVYDFFDRGPGDAAGIQDDLAIDRGPVRYLYTLDSKNNTFLRYSIAFDQLVEFTSAGDPHSASSGGVGERVGLDVIP